MNILDKIRSFSSRRTNSINQIQNQMQVRKKMPEELELESYEKADYRDMIRAKVMKERAKRNMIKYHQSPFYKTPSIPFENQAGYNKGRWLNQDEPTGPTYTNEEAEAVVMNKDSTIQKLLEKRDKEIARLKERKEIHPKLTKKERKEKAETNLMKQYVEHAGKEYIHKLKSQRTMAEDIRDYGVAETPFIFASKREILERKLRKKFGLKDKYEKEAKEINKLKEEFEKRKGFTRRIEAIKEKQLPLKVKEIRAKQERQLEKLKLKYTISGRVKSAMKNELKRLYHTGLQKKTKSKRIDNLIFSPTQKYYAGRGELNRLKREMMRKLQEDEYKRKIGLESGPFFSTTPATPQPEEVQTPNVFFNFGTPENTNVLGASQVSQKSQVKNNVQKNLFWRF